MPDNKIVKSLDSIIEILEPLKNALDDDGLESYADELYGVLERIGALRYIINNSSTTKKQGE